MLKYARDERVKYISHLDFIRTFHRTVRRAGLDMSFSHGYNPHPIMTVAMPLSVGITSDCEYMKIGFEGDYSPDEIKDRLNGALPNGFKIQAVCPTEGKKHDFNLLDRAEYTVCAEGKFDGFDAEKLLSNEKLSVMKKTKSGEKESDIRPYIYELKVLENTGDKIMLKMCLAAGNAYNLKVDTVLEAAKIYLDGVEVDFCQINRDKILAGGKELL